MFSGSFDPELRLVDSFGVPKDSSYHPIDLLRVAATDQREVDGEVNQTIDLEDSVAATHPEDTRISH
jgi:hypothetical protein